MPRRKTIDDDAVLDAAVALIGEVGPGALTLARVGDAVGLSAATLVQRFGSRRGLLLAVARRGVDTSPVFARARERSDSAVAALRSALLALAGPDLTPEALANHVAFLHMDLTDAEFRGLAVTQARSRYRAIRRLVGAAIATGEIACDDPSALAETIDVAYNGALITWAIHRDGSLGDWLGRQIDRVLAPNRTQ